ncbi:MAG: hypothetical protein ABEJ27_06775 [Halodesulfurarchaeum sp.]
MDTTRRTLIRSTGVVILAGLAGCAREPESENTTTTRSDEPTTSTTPPTTQTDAEPSSTTTTSTGDSTTESTTEATTESTSTTTSADAVSVVMDNVGIQAWEVLEDESGSVAPIGEDNPTLTLTVGERYAIENRGWDVHPLAFRAADDTPLLSQSADGSFESDPDVNWQDDGGRIAFTVTQELADALGYYICTIHSGMRGQVDTT